MIKSWFLLKNFTQNERQIIELAQAGGELTISKETEKAVQFKAVSDFGTFSFWCPKSCILKDGEIDKDLEKKVKAIDAGLSYNQKLVELAKSNGIKGVRTGMKTATLLKKLRENGIEIPSRN